MLQLPGNVYPLQSGTSPRASRILNQRSVGLNKYVRVPCAQDGNRLSRGGVFSGVALLQ